MPNAYYSNAPSSSRARKDADRKSYAFSDSGEHAPHPEEDRLSLDQSPSRPGLLAWNARITPSAVITAGFLLFFLLTLVFFFGFFVGKSTLPLTLPLVLEDLVPGSSPGQKDDADKNQQPDILEKEKLDFLTTLKGEQKGGILSEVEKPQPAPEKAAAPDNADAKKPAQAKEKEVPKEPQFEYVLRAAAFLDKASAQALAEKLGKNGMKTRVTSVKTQKKTWYYTQVIVRGTPEDLKQVRAKRSGLALRDAMLIQEKPLRK